jgi:ubiquinone/menaquinone biosynthesis C-methylase UbiE
MPSEPGTRKLVDLLAARLVPHRFLAAQLRRPSGRFGRWVMTRGLNHGNAELIAATLDALELRSGDRFMDLGFGGGLALALAAERTSGPLLGVDFSPDVVVEGAQRLKGLIRTGRLNLVCADVVDLPLRDGLVDAACTTNTLYFWPRPERALESLRRVLVPGGRLAIGYSGASKMNAFDRITRHGFTTYEPEQVERLLSAAGYTQVQTLAQTGRVSQGDFVSVAIAGT